MLPCSPRTDPYVHVNAYGSYRRLLTADHDTQPAVSAPPPVTRFPVSVYGTCFGFADSLWLQPFPRSTPPRLAPLCSPHSTVLWLHPTALPYSSSDSECLLSFRDLVKLARSGKALPGPDIGRAHIHRFLRHRRAQPHLTIAVQPILSSTSWTVSTL